MNLKNRVLSATLAVMLLVSCFALYGCTIVPDDKVVATPTPTAAGADASAEFTEAELNTPVITIGSHVVTLEEYIEFFDEVVAYYSGYGYDVSAEIGEFRGLVTDTLTTEKMTLYRADEYGLSTLTAEQEAEVVAEYDKSVAEMYEYYTELAKKELGEGATQEEIDAAVEEYVIEEAEYYHGEGTTKEQLLEHLKTDAREEYIRDLLKQYIIREVAVTDEEVTEWYNTALANDVTVYTDTPAGYKDDRETYDKTGAISDGKTYVPPLHVPTGYSRMLHILVGPVGEYSDTYETNAEKMEDLEAEYGTLSLQDLAAGTNANAARMAEIVTEYKTLNAANEAEAATLLGAAKTKIDEAYAKLVAGSDFRTIMTEYTEDESFVYETIREKGVLINPTLDNGYSTELLAAFGTLTIGTYSKVFLDDDGYHIIYYVSDETAGDLALADAKEGISKTLLTTAQDEVYNNKVESWLTNSDSVIVTNDALINRVTP